MTELSRIVDRIKDRLSIVDVLRPGVSIIRKGGKSMALCPFHKEKTPSFLVDIPNGSYHCFGCGKHGDHFTYLMERQGMTFSEALRTLADRSGVSLDDYTKRSAESFSAYVPKVRAQKHAAAESSASLEHEKNIVDQDTSPQKGIWYDAMADAALWYGQKLMQPRGQFVRDYLSKRGVTPEMVQQFGLGYSPESESLKAHLLKLGYALVDLIEIGLLTDKGMDRFKERLMFPIHDAKGRVIAFGGRALKADQMPKYLNSSDNPLFHKSFILYAQHYAFPHVTKEMPPIIVEGYMDVIALHQYGFKTAVAPLGTSFSDDHMKRLWQRFPTPVFCFDGDEAGKNAAFRVAQKVFPLLKPGFSVAFVFLPEGDDPDTYLKTHSAHAFHHLLKTPESLIDTLWQGYIQKFQITKSATPEVKTQFKKALMAHVYQIQDPDLKQFFKTDVSDRVYHFFSSFYNRTNSAEKGYAKNTSLSSTTSFLKDRHGKKRENFLDHSGLAPLDVKLSLQKVKKNQIPLKILLATLKNNPILIERVFEMMLKMTDLPEDFANFRNFLCENQFVDHLDVHQKAIDFGFSDVLKQLDVLHLQGVAPFCKPGSEEELALSCWKDIWYQHYVRAHVKSGTMQVKKNLAIEDEQAWAQWQQLKIAQGQSSDKS